MCEAREATEAGSRLKVLEASIRRDGDGGKGDGRVMKLMANQS